MQTNCCFAIVNGDYLKLQKITIRRHQLRITCLLIAVFMHLQVATVSVPVSGHVVSCQRRLVRTTGGAGESITLWLNRASYIHCVSNNAQTLRSCRFDKHRPVLIIFSQPSIYIDGWLYAMSMTSVVCNVPVLSQNDWTYHHSVFTT